MTGIADYWRMFRARGPGRVWHHFKDVTLFDFFHGTDTDTWLPLSAYREKIENIDLAVHYQPSFTSEIKKSLDFVTRVLGDSAKDYDFYDLGSGKGKVCFIALDYPFHSINGIEFYKPINDIAKSNARKFSDNRLAFHCADVTRFEFVGDQLVFFAYNPFDLKIWNELLSHISGKRYVVIYNNPVHVEIYYDKEIWFQDTASKWENKRTVIFANFRKPEQ